MANPQVDPQPARTWTGARTATVPDLVARLRSDGIVQFASETLCRYHAVEYGRVIRHPFRLLVPEPDRPRVDAALEAIGPDQRTAALEVQGPPHLPPCFVHWLFLGIFDPEDRLQEIHAFGRDVTHDREVEADAARLAAIVAGADDAIVSKTLDGVITSWNPAAERMFGYTAAEALGRSITLIIPTERLHEEAEILARLARGERTEHFETERLRKDGRLIEVSVNVSPVRDPSGRTIGASKVARDITEQRRAQREREAGIRSLEALYRLADAVGRAQSRWQVCDAALAAIATALGTTRASALLLDERGAMRFVAWRGLSDRYRQAVEGHSPWSADTVDAEPIVVEDVLLDDSLGPLRGAIVAEGIRALAFIPVVAAGRLLGKFMVYFDRPRALSSAECRVAETIGRHLSFGLTRVDALTAVANALARERAARSDADTARAEAERANRAKDEFLAMLAHELRNPLSVVMLAADSLAEHPLPEETRQGVTLIERQSRHLSSLLDDLLDVARITSGRIELRDQPVDLKAVVGLAAEALRSQFDAKAQRLQVALPAGRVAVRGDPVRLQQVVQNLLHNACKYTPTGGAVGVELVEALAEATIRVWDDGAGIAPDHLASVFDLFVQGAPTLARTEGGLGIGLTLVKRLVELHGGDVSVRSEGLGRGAEFEVRLPTAEPPPTRSKRAASVRPPHGQRILVVEDNPDGREALVLLLRRAGNEVHEVGTGERALAVAREHELDAVVLDIGLPDLDGYQVARRLREELGGRVRLVALTGYGQPADRARGRDAGFDAYLIKPVHMAQIAASLGGDQG